MISKFEENRCRSDF